MNYGKLPDSACNLKFDKTVRLWDEAVPLGNGLCGALIWGEPGHLRFSLDRGDIWDTTPDPGVLSEEFTYQNMIRLVGERNEEEIRRIFDTPYTRLLPSKLPAGNIVFDLGCEGNVCSELDLARAEARIAVNDICIRSFLHAEEKTGYVEIGLPADRFSFYVENPEYGIRETDEGAGAEVESSGLKTGESGKNGDRKDTGKPRKDAETTPPEDSETAIDPETASAGPLKQLKYEKPEVSRTDDGQYFVQKISETFSYGVFVKLREKEGRTLLVYWIGSSLDGADWKEKALEKLENALDRGYEEAFASHSVWWESFWGKSSVTLPDPLFEKNWYLTNYFLGCCSRKGCYPMPLQGVWTADNGALPPWKGDYHHDLNTQLSYYSYLKANHLEEGETFTDYLWSMRDGARDFARRYYGARGICLPAVMAIDGTPLGGWGMYSLSPANQLWLCQAFERHYRFSGDRDFLKERAYPYLKETAEFILDILEERDGRYYLPISSSPEIHDDHIEAFLTPNSNYDLALMRYLFTALASLAEELGNGEEETWREHLGKCPDLAVDKDGVLMLSPDERLTESHRHQSHAMAIHPLRLMPYDTEENKKVIDATVLDLERMGTGNWVGYSFTWLAEFYAVQGNGNGAAHQLEVFWKYCCSQNGFHLNGDYRNAGVTSLHYRPFTLEGNFCAADALQEMLLQSENGILALFPAIPDEWKEKKVSFEDFRAEKGLLVSAEWEKGELTALTLKPQYDGEIFFRDYEQAEKIFRNTEVTVEERAGMGVIRAEGGKVIRGGSCVRE